MKAWLFLTGIWLAAACTNSHVAMPSDADVDRLEGLLRSNECVGSLDRWERHYFFESEPIVPGDPSVRSLNRHKIGFIFHQAGFEEFRDRRVIHSTAREVVSVDDRPYLTADGTYDIDTGRMEIGYCGPNI